MGVPQRVEEKHQENPYSYESVKNTLFAKLAKFLAENEHTRGKKIEIVREYPTQNATAFVFELKVIGVENIEVFALLKGSNSPLKAIGEIVDIDEAQYTVSLKMDISH